MRSISYRWEVYGYDFSKFYFLLIQNIEPMWGQVPGPFKCSKNVSCYYYWLLLERMADKKNWKSVSLTVLSRSCPTSLRCWNSSPLVISSAWKRVLSTWVEMSMMEFLAGMACGTSQEEGNTSLFHGSEGSIPDFSHGSRWKEKRLGETYSGVEIKQEIATEDFLTRKVQIFSQCSNIIEIYFHPNSNALAFREKWHQRVYFQGEERTVRKPHDCWMYVRFWEQLNFFNSYQSWLTLQFVQF